MSSMTLCFLLSIILLCGEIRCLPKYELYPFGPDVDSQLPRDIDDISSPELQLNVPIVFYETLYRSIFVNDNGLISFLTEVPRFFNAQFPLSYPIIAPLYSDVDTRGTGTVYYRETQAAELLDRATQKVHRYFSQSSSFQARSLFIVTWDAVGHYNQATLSVNTFQIIIASDGSDSYVFFLYPERGIQWIQGEGKYPNLPDARAQAGFMAGDGRLYTLRGSGTDQARNFDRMSNIRQPGVWLFRVGRTETTGNIMPADIEEVPGVPQVQSCASAIIPCPPTSTCADFENGFCCICRETHIGNGLNCLEKDRPLRLSGKVNGVLNDYQLSRIDLHSYIVASEGRTYTAVSQVPPSIGYDMQTLTVLGGVIGWLFAAPATGVKNGFMITGGAFNRTTEMAFPQTGHQVTVKETFLGTDVYNYLKSTVDVKGSLPAIPSGSKIQIEKYEEEYTRVAKGMIRSRSSRSYRLEGNYLEVPFTIDQTIMYTPCEYQPEDPNLNTLRLVVDRNFITYDVPDQIVRYASTSEIFPYSTEDPCKNGRDKCPENSNCVVDGTRFICVCNLGYEQLYQGIADGDSVICVDINECATGRDNCHNNAECLNTHGSYMCRCLHGYVGDGIVCTKIETCEDLRCNINADCVQLSNLSFTCVCKTGYHGNGYSCEPESQPDGSNCFSNAECHPNANCVTTVENDRYVHRCQCLEGFIGNGIICIEDTESCNVMHDCHPDATCLFDSSINRYQCKCNPGFAGDGKYCYSEDCNVQDNCHPHAQCIYTSSGHFKCQCNAGYVGDGYYCETVDDVDCDQVNKCSLHATCIYDTYIGKHVCRCNDGYDGDGFTCRPIDECNSVDNCDRNAQCIYDSTLEKYRCLCNPGYVGDGKTCLLKDDVPCNVEYNCGLNAHCAYDHLNSRYKCECVTGFEGDGFTCQKKSVSCNIINNCGNHASCMYDIAIQGYRCICDHGYEGDGHTCVPVRSCYDDPLVCDLNAECVYDSTGYHCRCIRGYSGDGFTCTVSPIRDADFLVFTQGMSLLQMPFDPSPNNPGKLLLMEAHQTALGIDVDCKNGYIYWTDNFHQFIRRVKYDGSDSEIVFTRDLRSPEGIAVDWVSGNFYWTDSIKDTIEVATLDGSYHKTLFNDDLVNPRGIAVHPGWGKLYWTDWNRKKPKIEVSNMDGTDRKILIDSDLGLPNMITVDIQGNDICWTDAGLHRIECSTLDGYGRRVVYTPAKYPFDLTIAYNNIYWTDWEIKFVQRVSKHGGIADPLAIPLGGNGRLYGIATVPSQCLPVTNPCAVENGGCRYLCLPDGRGGRNCACPDNVDPDSDPECNVN